MKKIKEFLEKKKVSALMGFSNIKGPEEINESGDDDSAKAIWDPLGPEDQRTTTPSASVSHSHIESPSCNEDWGLLGCVELYKLKTAKE